MKELLVQTYYIVLPILLGYIVYILKNQKKDRDANAEGTMTLLMVKLIEYHDKYVPTGEIPSYVYSNYTKMYNAYRKLGGNSVIVKMKEEVDRLEIKSKKEK